MVILKTIQSDLMTIIVADSRDSTGQLAAEAAGACIRELLSRKDEINIIFAAAPSQNETLYYLIREPGIDWSRINAFHMDEYVGLAENAPQTFGTYLQEHIFGLVPFKTVHHLQGWADDVQAECARYGKLLEDNPVDIVMLGIGENGHIAFNDPWVADFNDPARVKVVPLDPVCRQQQVNDGCFPTIDDVPTHALSLTIPSLVAAAHMFCTVPAPTKREAVTKTVNEPISEKVPATIMRRHAHAVMFCDPDSGKDLL